AGAAVGRLPGGTATSREVCVLTALDAHAVRHWAVEMVRALEEHRAEIDDLNVYPVPDGDTGTNMTLTAQAAADALRSSPAADPKGCLGALARGAVLGARGNSGVILSQILCGLADACPPPAAGRPALEAWVPGQPVPGRPDLGPPVPDQAAL